MIKLNKFDGMNDEYFNFALLLRILLILNCRIKVMNECEYWIIVTGWIYVNIDSKQVNKQPTINKVENTVNK